MPPWSSGSPATTIAATPPMSSFLTATNFCRRYGRAAAGGGAADAAVVAVHLVVGAVVVDVGDHDEDEEGVLADEAGLSASRRSAALLRTCSQPTEASKVLLPKPETAQLKALATPAGVLPSESIHLLGWSQQLLGLT
jgi:hypothetical protein